VKFLSDMSSEGAVGGFAGIIIGILGLAKVVIEWRASKRMKAMSEIPPSKGMTEEEVDPEITRRLQNLEHATIARMEWSITEARDECRRLQAELSEVKRDLASTSQELMTARYTKQIAQMRVEDLQRELEESEKRSAALAEEVRSYHRQSNAGLYTRKP
jgi:septal ring factor EnvC (AmiA/AmiB activator)